MLDPPAKLMRGLVEAFVLRSLDQAPKHGYALMKELEDVFGDEPNRNRIYPLLARLEDADLVDGEEDPDSSRGKTVYHLTDAGRARLRAYERMPASFQAAVRQMWPSGAAGNGEGGDAPPEESGQDPTGDEVSDASPEDARGAGGNDVESPGGLVLDRDPRTGEVELRIEGTVWGPVRLMLGRVEGSGEDGEE